MKILSPRVHGYLDYLVVAALALAPVVLGFHGTPAILCYALAVAHFALTALTNFPLGIVKRIPFTVHGGIEVAATVFLLAAPWLFAFSNVASATGFFVASGVALGIVWLVTDYKGVAHDRSHARVSKPHVWV